MVPFKKTLSRPVSSGWNPVPTSRRDAIRPWTSSRPEVGAVILERILSSVDLPAPLPPISASTSPSRTSNETSQGPMFAPAGAAGTLWSRLPSKKFVPPFLPQHAAVDLAQHVAFADLFNAEDGTAHTVSIAVCSARLNASSPATKTATLTKALARSAPGLTAPCPVNACRKNSIGGTTGFR